MFNGIRVHKVGPAGFQEAVPEEPFGEFHAAWSKLPGVTFVEALSQTLGIEHLGALWGDGADPGAYYDVKEVLDVLGNPQLMWWNPRRLVLVLDDGTQRVGVRSSALRVPIVGFKWAAVEELYQGLKARIACH